MTPAGWLVLLAAVLLVAALALGTIATAQRRRAAEASVSPRRTSEVETEPVAATDRPAIAAPASTTAGRQSPDSAERLDPLVAALEGAGSRLPRDGSIAGIPVAAPTLGTEGDGGPIWVRRLDARIPVIPSLQPAAERLERDDDETRDDDRTTARRRLG